MSLPFLGKWTFAQGNAFVQIDPASGALKVAAQPADGSEKFNAYGTTSAFVLQANNGQYVVASGSSYVASAARTATLNQFALDSGDAGAFRIKDLGANGQGSQFYWNNANGALGQVPVSSPPATTNFAQTIITPDLNTIFQNGFSSPQPDLSWAYLSGVDFNQATAQLDFSQSNLSHADFSQAKFPDQTGFEGCTGQYANFANTALTGAIIGSAHMEHSDFTKAIADGADFSGSFFNDATMTGIKLRQSDNLAGTHFNGAHLEGADFTGSGNILNTDFTGAFLMGALFTGSSVTGPMILNGADLTGAYLNNPGMVTIYPKMIQLDAKTNFTQAHLQNLDFTGYDLSNVVFTHADLTGCKLDRTTLQNTEFGYAVLDGVTFTGGISMQGANFSNASLMGVDLTGAQMGAIGLMFRVSSPTPDYTNLLAGLQNADGDAVAKVFNRNGHPLQGKVAVTVPSFAPAGTRWQVEVTLPAPATYTVISEKMDSSQTLGVYQPTTPAVLTNAFMVNANLTGANLYAVRASGAQLYATAGKKVNLNRAKLDGLQINNGNLGSIDLSQADLPGVNFDYSILTGAKFTGAQIHVDAAGGQTSFNGANLQGADFTSATITNAVFTNAAVSVPSPADPSAFAGVWLFGLSAQDATLVVPELNAASPDPNAPPTDPQHQFTIPIELLQLLSTPGPVPKGIAAAFADANITLSASALLTILTESIYWQVSDGSANYVIFEACDSSNYEPSLGVASGAKYTPNAKFFLPLSLESLLANGPVNSTLAAAFNKEAAKKGLPPLSNAAKILIAQHPTSWQVVDSPTIYSLWLDLQSTLSGCSIIITARPALWNTINAFGDVSIALSQRATVTRLDKNAGWVLSNDAENPFNPVKNYIEFQIFPNSSKGIDVYGSLMRIIRMKSPTEEQFFNIPCSTTVLTQQQMSTNTICPNSDAVSTNQSNKIPFNQWMRARFLPSPPFCVPDPQGNFNCPQ